MKKYSITIILFLISFTAISQRDISNRTIQNYELVKERLLKYNNRSIPTDEEIQTYLDTQNTDGSWPDIVYNTNVKTTQWTSAEHLRRFIELAQAFSETGQSWYKNAAILSSVYAAIDYWAANDFQTTNFPGKRIYAQQYITIAYLNIERVEAVPQSYIDKTQAIIDRATKPKAGKIGGNNFWFSQIQMLISLFYDDVATFEFQLDLIYQVYTQLPGEEGIQPDGSYQFHGNELSGSLVQQVQFGNYGTSIMRDMVWLEMFADTPYAFNDFSNFGHIRNYFANGIGWTYWDDEMDYNLMPRTNDYGQTFDRANKGIEAKKVLINADPAYASEYEKVLTWPNQLIGFKSFWQSDIGICRTANWYASVTMSSNRIIRGESINTENQKGLHQSDGVLMFQQSGKEYENIGGLWDWKMLPGVTCDQGITKLHHPHYSSVESLVETSYAGTIGTEASRGMASMINKREDLYAQKSWFFDNDVIVCLGSGINGPTKSNVYTTLQQSFKIGEVKDKNGNVLTSGENSIAANDWIYHDNAVYQATNPYTVDIRFRQDNWSKLEKLHDREDEGTIFSSWIDHGASPTDENYAYYIYPQADGSAINSRIDNRPKIIANTKDVHAIRIADRLYASFFTAGSITSSGTTLEVNIPCLLAIDGSNIYVADPNHNQSQVVVKINDSEFTIDLPTGEYIGSSKTVNTSSPILSTAKFGETFTNVVIHPNPSNKIFTIELGALKNVSLEVTNMKGQTVYSESQINSASHTVELHDAPGVYLLKINSNYKSQTYELILN